MNVTPAAFEISNIIAVVVGLAVVAIVVSGLYIERMKRPASHGGAPTGRSGAG